MIRVSFGVLALIFLLLMLGPIFIAWLANEFRRSRREQAAFRHVLRCGICTLEFEDRTETVLPRCPRCGSLNERYPVSRG
jgi:uncharacterized paraquat-inducible protein A